ncbi:MAG: hypothetical protein IJV04_01060, partial [Lachnospiraceae bacterium]|nr:hypothetical protein [Lachnospiraceae bacterium]
MAELPKRHPPATRKASYTVEASLTLPIFVFVCACILIFFRILSVEWGVEVALNETAREIAVVTSGTRDKEDASKEGASEGSGRGDDSSGLKQTAIVLAQSRILMHKTPLSVVRLGVLGLNFNKSKVDKKNVDLAVSYKIPLPVSFFGIREVAVSQRAVAHRWVGFDPEEGKGTDEEGDTVYITESGTAYHKSSGCSYLNPSIRPVSAA